jgi:putative drug exporter of the RND superfamily
VILAATFAALAQLPSVSVTEVGTAVAIGMLLDTLLVRTVLVLAALITIGDRSGGQAPPGDTGPPYAD